MRARKRQRQANHYRRTRQKKSSLLKPIITGIICIILAILGYQFFSKPNELFNSTENPLTIPDINKQLKPRYAPVEHTKIPDNEHSTKHNIKSFSSVWEEYKVKSGESLSLIFSKNNLSKKDLHNIVHTNDIGPEFAKIRPNNHLIIGRNITGNLSYLIYKKSPFEEIKATRLKDNTFKVERILQKVDRRISQASGTIHSSLFIDAKKAGLSDKLIMNLANIYAWDIDFALNLRDGDQFHIIYETLHIDNKEVDTGRILAVDFINNKKSIKTIRYENKQGKIGYYSPKGSSMRKAFIRMPIDFARISSSFNLKRKHPVLNRIRAHKGVDYAAKTGTPIKVTGDGKITFRGKQRGYGNVVIVQHGKAYSTLYAHLSKFKRGQRRGSHVNQSDIIGYVGQTGLASGPHLHYEFRVNGAHRNPVTVKLPNALPMASRYKKDFLRKSKKYVQQLKQLKTRYNKTF